MQTIKRKPGRIASKVVVLCPDSCILAYCLVKIHLNVGIVGIQEEAISSHE